MINRDNYIILGAITQGDTLKLALWDEKNEQVIVKDMAIPYAFVSQPGIPKQKLEKLLETIGTKYKLSRHNNKNFIVYVDMQDKNQAEKRYIKDLLRVNRCVLFDGIDVIRLHFPMFGIIENKKINGIIGLNKYTKKASLEQIVQMPLAAIDVENFFINKQALYMASIIVKKQGQNCNDDKHYVGYIITTIPKENLNGKIHHKISNKISNETCFEIINVNQPKDISRKVKEILEQHNVVFLAFHNAQHDVDQLNFPDRESKEKKKRQFSSIAETSMYKKPGGFYRGIKALGNHVIDGTGLWQRYFSFLLNGKLKTFASFLFPELKERICEEKIHSYEELEELAKIAHMKVRHNQPKQAALDIAKRNSFDALITLMIAEQFLPLIVQACEYYNADTSQVCMTSPIDLYINRKEKVESVRIYPKQIDKLKERKLNNFQLQIIKSKQDCHNSSLSSPAKGFVLVPTIIYAYMQENKLIPNKFDNLNFSHSLVQYVLIKMCEQTRVFELNEKQLTKQAEQFWEIVKQYNAKECIKFGENLIYVIQPNPTGLFASMQPSWNELEELVMNLESEKLVYNLGRANIAFTNSKQAKFIAYLLERKTIIKENIDISKQAGSYSLLELKFRGEFIEALVVNLDKKKARKIVNDYLELLHDIDEKDERLQTVGVKLNREAVNYIATNDVIKMILGGSIQGKKGKTYNYYKDKKKIEKKIKEFEGFLH